MNRRLLDPFQSVALPEIIEEYFEHGVTTCLSFNRRGTLLAAGNLAGEVVIWDFDTKGVARTYTGHSASVTSLAWSRDGKFLVSGAKDNSIILWDVLPGKQAYKIELPAAVTDVSISSRAPYRCVASLAEGAPVLVDFELKSQKEIPMADADVSSKSKASSSDSRQSAVAIFNRQADLIYVGQPKGTVAVLDAQSLRFLDVIKMPSTKVLNLRLNRKGTHMLASCQDRVIRMYELMSPALAGPSSKRGYDDAELKKALIAAAAAGCKGVKSGSLLYSGGSGCAPYLTPSRDFQNVVERMAWRAVCFSSDTEHVFAASASKSSHHIYVWNRLYGNIERILEGPKEGIQDIVWHPLRSILLSVTPAGRIYCWARAYAENWSAFAPDFKELEENREYVEREDEFDWNTPSAEQAEKKDAADPSADNEDVDILTMDVEHVFSSDGEDEAEEQLHYLPVEIIPDAEDDGKPKEGEEERGEEEEEDGGDDQDGDKALERDAADMGGGRRKRRVNWQELEKEDDDEFMEEIDP